MIRVRVTWVPDDVPGRLLAAPQVMSTCMRRLMERVQVVGLRASSTKAPVDKRHLRDSLYPGRPGTASMVSPFRMLLGSNLPYAGAQEDAARFTTRKKWRPPYAAIKDWVRRRRLNLGVEAKDVARVAWAICNKIATKGIRPKHYMQAGFEAILAVLPREVERTADEMLKEAGLK